MNAIILAAGMGKRLKNLTANNTKCMVKVNGVTLIERMLQQLDTLGLSEIIIVTGYEGQKLKDFIGTLDVSTPIAYVDNPIYDKTNNIYSLALAKEYLKKDDALLLESDLIFDDRVLQDLVADPRPSLALVDKYESWMDGTVVTLGKDDSIRHFIPGRAFEYDHISEYYKTVNIYKFSKHFSQSIYVPFLEAYCKALGNNEYYEQVLRVITMLDTPEIQAKRMNGALWYEIDDIQDLDIAESMFAENEKKISLLSRRFGGYWRYPKLIDFCYLVNPYFPPKRMMDEIKSNFETLLTQYPSGLRVNCLLAAKNFSIKEEYMLVGNGAAELIRSLMLHISGKVGFIRPTFEEYPNRFPADSSVIFYPNAPDYRYTAHDLISFYSDKNISALILINPDNPTGNYLSKADVLSLAAWAKGQNITLVYDESFADFADEPDNSLITNSTLETYHNLIVLKSISKSYGVPGLRLGILATANTEILSAVKADVSIWNINSFAEFYLQIAEKYHSDYMDALHQFRNARHIFVNGLKKIPHLQIFDSQANYVMVKVLDGYTAKQLAIRLLAEYNILIKDLSSKVHGQEYIRLAVRDITDNSKLLLALEEILA